MGRQYLLFIACLSLLACWNEVPPVPTLRGPEAPDLLSQTRGYIVTRHRHAGDGNTSEIAAIALPGLQQTVIRPPINGEYVLVSQVSGPDEQGRIAYVQENARGGTARLNTIRLDGTGKQVIVASGGVSYDVFGAYPTLAPRGGNIAVMERDMRIDCPSAMVERLVIWNADTKKKSRVAVDAENIGVSWFPDGNKLVYVASARRDTTSQEMLNELTGDDQTCRESIGGSELMPVAYTLDVQSGEIRPLRAGTNPVVSSDGRSVLVQCGGFVRIDLASRSARPTKWPGYTQLHMVSMGSTQTPLAFLGGRLVLYWSLPTEGSPVMRAPYGSFDAARQLVTIKLAAIGTGKFQTVIPAIDPQWQVSFGQTAVGIDAPRDPTPIGRLY